MTAGGRNARPDQIRSAAIRMVRRDGLTIRAVAEVLDVPQSTIRAWVMEYPARRILTAEPVPECVRLLAKWPNLTMKE